MTTLRWNPARSIDKRSYVLDNNDSVQLTRIDTPLTYFCTSQEIAIKKESEQQSPLHQRICSMAEVIKWMLHSLHMSSHDTTTCNTATVII